MKRSHFRRKKRLMAVNEDANEPEEEATPYTSPTLRLAIVESGEFVSWASLSGQELLQSRNTNWTVLPRDEDADDDDRDYATAEDLEGIFLFGSEKNEEENEQSSSQDEQRVPFCLMAGEGKGEAEMIRLLFTVAGQSYEEIVVTEGEMEDVLATIPSRKLPVLIKGDEMWADIPATVRLLARMFNLLGQSNDEHLVVEATYEKLRYLKVKHNKAYEWGTQGAESKDKVEWACHQLKYDILPTVLEEWNKLIMATAGPFVVASGMTLADIAIMDFLDQCSAKIQLEELMTDYLALSDLTMLVKRNSKINYYLRERAMRD